MTFSKTPKTRKLFKTRNHNSTLLDDSVAKKAEEIRIAKILLLLKKNYPSEFFNNTKKKARNARKQQSGEKDIRNGATNVINAPLSPQKIPFSADIQFYVLISTILSQRTRDEVTYSRSKALFKELKIISAKDLASKSAAEIAGLIKPVGFYKTKAKRIKDVARIIAQKHNNKVPQKIEDLLALPGVGRKTANCVLVYGFNKPAIPVDTHVHRISNRLGIVRTNNPESTELKLMKIIPKKEWIMLNEALVRHGQGICRPIIPKCKSCFLSVYCDYRNSSSIE